MYPYIVTQDKVLVLYFDTVFDTVKSIDIYYGIRNPKHTSPDEHTKPDLDVKYGYSIDNVNWSRYYIDEEEFLETLRDLGFEQSQVYIRIRLEFIYPKAIEYLDTLCADSKYTKDFFNDDSESIILESIKLNKSQVIPKRVEFVNQSEFTVNADKQLYNPYFGMDLAVDIWEKMSASVNKMFGHWAYYFRTQPSTDKDDVSVTFKQYKLINVVDMKLVKILVPGNTFPSNRNVYSEWGIAMPDEFTLHIVTSEFQRAFGYNTKPNERDYLYLPICGKMYDLNSVYEDQQFMLRSVKYDCIAIKHEKQESIETNGYDVNNFIDYVMDANGETRDEQEENVSKPQFMDLMITDAYRLNMHNNLNIVEYPLEIDGVMIYQNMYQLSTCGSEQPAVQFNMKQYIPENMSLNWWMYLESVSSIKPLFRLDSFLTISVFKGLQITYNGFKSLICDKPFAKSGLYACSISFSNQFSMIRCIIYQYVDNGFVEICNNEIDVAAYNKPISRLSLYGGKCLVSNICVNKSIIDIDNALNKLTESLPVGEDNILFDKALLPMGETEFSV